MILLSLSLVSGPRAKADDDVYDVVEDLPPAQEMPLVQDLNDDEEALHADNEEMMSVLIKENDLYKMDLQTCESSLQQSFDHPIADTHWYQEPIVLVGGGLLAVTIGVILGSLASNR